MTFQGLLFENRETEKNIKTLEAPAFFIDLNLDRVIEAITAGKDEYNLKPIFYSALDKVNTIKYRQEIAEELEDKNLSGPIKCFAEKMSTMRRHLAMLEKLNYKYHQEGWFLEAVRLYCDAVCQLEHDLSKKPIKSRGISSFYTYLKKYTKSSRFRNLCAATRKLKADLSSIKYCVIINGSYVRVCQYKSEIDYSKEVESTFERFKQGEVKDYKVDLSLGVGMNHVEAKILDLVARLFAETFLELDDYCTQNAGFLDKKIVAFDQEVQFYISYLDFIQGIKQAGLDFCYPRISVKEKQVSSRQGFDLALANLLVSENSPVICNDFYLKGKERILIISGPNQGGKTTFARTFGQLHFLASLGLPVPGKSARLFLFDRLLTHFEKEEDIKNLRGKLQDDMVRIHEIIHQATPKSIILLNEIFTSTTLKDAVFLSKKIAEKIINLDCLCVWVSFIDELASLSEKNVSMVSTVDPDNPAVRTFKIVRQPANGLAYALSIAEKYRLTYEQLKERIK